MRTLMTLLTLGAGGAGYAYLQQTPAIGESFSSRPPLTSSPVFTWDRSAVTRSNGTRVQIKELVSRIHEHTKSVLDDFADQHGGHSDAPGDDAFQRLRQVAQSVAISASARSDAAPPDHTRKEWPAALPALNELQRIAFHPAESNGPADEPLVTPFSVVDSADDRPMDSAAAPATDAAEPATVMKNTKLSPAENATKSEAALSSVSRAAPTIEKRSSDANPSANRRRPNPYAGIEWKEIGKTTEGRPMHTMQLGDVGTRTLVIAGLNGEDRTAVRWLELLADELKIHPDFLKTNQVVFFRAGNPDGLVRKVAANARGVQLNRNFPSRRYRPAAGQPQFAAPAGEMETRVILETLYGFRPRRVIHLASTGGQSQAIYNRPATQLADELKRSAKFGIQLLDAEQCPGSLEDFVDGTLDASVLSIRLSVGNDWQKAWGLSRHHMLSAVVGLPVEAIRGETSTPADPDRSPIPNVNIEPVSRRPQRRGYEELPAPPKN